MAVWVLPALMAAGGAIMGNESAKAANKQRRQEQKMNEIEARYSHWLAPNYRDVSPGASATGSIIGGAMMGGMQGMGMNKGLGIGGGTDPTQVASKSSMIGAPNYAAQYQKDFGSVVPDVQKKIDAAMATPYTGPAVAAQSKYMPPSVDQVTLDPTTPLVVPDATLDAPGLLQNPEVYPEGYMSPMQQQIQRSMYMDPRFSRQFGAGLIAR